MAFQEIPAGADIATVTALVNNVIRDLNNKEVTTIYKDTSGIRRVVIGKLADGSYGFVVSKSGYDAYTAVSS